MTKWTAKAESYPERIRVRRYVYLPNGTLDIENTGELEETGTWEAVLRSSYSDLSKDDLPDAQARLKAGEEVVIKIQRDFQ